MPGTHFPATATSPEHWTGPKAEAEAVADTLGYPVLVAGVMCARKVEAREAIKAATGNVTVSRPGAQEAPEPAKQETKDGRTPKPKGSA